MVRDLDRVPAPRRLQSGIVVGIALLISAPFYLRMRHSGDPAASLGLGLQTLSGLVASVQLWANATADALVSWIARQIGRGRSRVLGLLDGRASSMFIAAGCYVAAMYVARILWALTPPGPVGFAVAVPALLILAFTALAFVLAMFMFVGVVISPKEPPPEGEALTGLQTRLAQSTWFWPLMVPVFVIGGLLQL
jgi:MFS family permease